MFFSFSITVLFCYRFPPGCLALDEIYHLIWAAFPNSPTLRKAAACWHDAEVAYGTLALYVAPFSEGLYPRRHARDRRS